MFEGFGRSICVIRSKGYGQGGKWRKHSPWLRKHIAMIGNLRASSDEISKAKLLENWLCVKISCNIVAIALKRLCSEKEVETKLAISIERKK